MEDDEKTEKPNPQSKMYNVGKGKPPKHTQFKPGQSGNPRGRPKRKPAITSNAEAQQRFLEAASSAVVIRENGRRKRMTMMEAIDMRCIQMALQGNLRAIQLFYKYRAEALANPQVRRQIERVPKFPDDPFKAADLYRAMISGRLSEYQGELIYDDDD